jgi:hypothetical protein
VIRRLGTAPRDRTGRQRSFGGTNCPDVLHTGDRIIVIGELLDSLPDGAPADAGIGPTERAVAIPLSIFRDAARALPEVDE